MADPKSFVEDIAGGMSADGRLFRLRFILADGQQIPVIFPSERAAAIVTTIAQVVGEQFNRQRDLLKGHDPRAFFPVGAFRTSKIEGGITQEGRPVLSVSLESGLRLDIQIERSTIPELIAILQDIEGTRVEEPRSPH
jgi:hypothetical protein